MIRRNNKRALYESIMRDVSKIIKRHLNEGSNLPSIELQKDIFYKLVPCAFVYDKDMYDIDDITNEIDNFADSKIKNNNIIFINDWSDINPNHVVNGETFDLFDDNKKNICIINANNFINKPKYLNVILTMAYENRYGDNVTLPDDTSYIFLLSSENIDEYINSSYFRKCQAYSWKDSEIM